VGLERGDGPLYVQIRDAIRQQIDGQSLPPGAPLPTEDELQATYGVSRSVVRQALGQLADWGLIVRQRGRGSVVAPPHEHHRRANQAGGLHQQLASAGQQLRTEVLSLAVQEPPPDAAAALRTAHTWRLERLRSVDDEPVVYMCTWLPADLFPTLSAEELDGGSLHDWMRSLGHQPHGGPRRVQAVPADPVVTQHLGCQRGAPVLLMQGVTQDTYGRGLEWFSAWHRPHTVFDIDASVNPAPHTTNSEPPDLNRVRELVTELTSLMGMEPNASPAGGHPATTAQRP
jgi:GntR family transcriptional regulator